jgi:hypothetical protein
MSYTSRGGAVYQKKDWAPLNLTTRQTFVHCGSAPFAPESKGLLLSFSKEICDVPTTDSKTWVLGFPLLDPRYAGLYPPNEFDIAKAATLLWSEQEMPRGFVFQIPTGTTVYTKNAVLAENSEVGFNFDIVFRTMLWAQYRRDGKKRMRLKDIWNGPTPRH